MGGAGSVLDDEPLSPPASPVRKNNTKARDESAVYPTFPVSLAYWPNSDIVLPPQFLLKISYESLDFVRSEDNSALVQFPYQNIICWGSSPSNFQFKIFDLTKEDDERRDNGILISLRTMNGKKIEDETMSTVKKLMVDMESRAISKQEFRILLSSIFDENDQLKEDWMPIINQFTSGGRCFLAKQGMELLVRVGSQAPFEKVELAVLIYERMINKNSVQLIINSFEEQEERDNLIHRLKLTKQNVVADCATIPEKRP